MPLRSDCRRQSAGNWRYLFCGTGRPRTLKSASRTLSGTPPCGVRTFLSRLTPARAKASGSDRPVPLPEPSVPRKAVAPVLESLLILPRQTPYGIDFSRVLQRAGVPSSLCASPLTLTAHLADTAVKIQGSAMAKTIFVVNDSVTMVMSLKSTLSLYGFQSESAGNGRPALDRPQAGFKPD